MRVERFEKKVVNEESSQNNSEQLDVGRVNTTSKHLLKHRR